MWSSGKHLFLCMPHFIWGTIGIYFLNLCNNLMFCLKNYQNQLSKVNNNIFWTWLIKENGRRMANTKMAVKFKTILRFTNKIYWGYINPAWNWIFFLKDIKSRVRWQQWDVYIPFQLGEHTIYMQDSEVSRWSVIWHDKEKENNFTVNVFDNASVVCLLFNHNKVKQKGDVIWLPLRKLSIEEFNWSKYMHLWAAVGPATIRKPTHQSGQ